jgi:integrase
MDNGEISFVTQKTGRRIHIPNDAAGDRLLDRVANERRPRRIHFPERGKVRLRRVAIESVSRNPCGRRLAKVKHYRRMKSKDAPLRREGSEISFRSLRHSAVTMLKAAGVSDFIAREVIGHESEAISRQYSHLTTDHKRAAMRNLPDVTQS